MSNQQNNPPNGANFIYEICVGSAVIGYVSNKDAQSIINSSSPWVNVMLLNRNGANLSAAKLHTSSISHMIPCILTNRIPSNHTVTNAVTPKKIQDK